MGTRLLGAVGALAALLGAAGLAHAGASWVGQPYQLSIPTHITASGQSVSGSVNLTLDHDTPCTLVISVASAGDEVLKRGAATLATFYKLTGPTIPDGDADWVSSDAFLTHVYTVLGSGSADTITLSAKGTAPAQWAPDAGEYTAAVVLTASW